MGDEREYIELVRRGQHGDQEALNLLAGMVRERLCQHVYRITLRDDLTQDIVQESLLEMSKILGKLQKADRFWPWLCGIASKKLQRHYRSETRQRVISQSMAERQGQKVDSQDGMADLVTAELKQNVLGAMASLRTRQREVLALRCYEQMPYSQIAQLMGCSEFSARMLFCRAKKSLQKQLSRSGLSKATLLPALILFGRMTARTEAEVSLASGVLNVGAAATLTSLAASKATVAVAAGVLAAGAVVAVVGPSDTSDMSGFGRGGQSGNVVMKSPAGGSVGDSGQWWYYFPDASGAAMMTRRVSWSSPGNGRHSQILQNDHANYYFDKSSNRVYINNYRMWHEDLAVQRLPNDKPELTEFITKVEGRDTSSLGYVTDEGAGMLVIGQHNAAGEYSRPWVDHHANTPEEAYFQCDWPSSAKLVDTRDMMHKRGWTCFRVVGELGDRQVQGAGRIPFVYAMSSEYWPWLRLQLDDGTEAVDWGSGAAVYGPDERVISRCPGGTFLLGLSRPWLGLHSIDTIRRDAAEQRIWFETRYTKAQLEAEVVITHDSSRIVYVVNMERDLVDKITVYLERDDRWVEQGELRFSYLAGVDDVSEEFVEPRRSGGGGTERPGMLWPVYLAKGSIGN